MILAGTLYIRDGFARFYCDVFDTNSLQCSHEKRQQRENVKCFKESIGESCYIL